MNHYDWLERNFATFLGRLGLVEHLEYYHGLISDHGDKCWQYQYQWEKCEVPFEHGVAIYLLTYVWPYSFEVRETDYGWVAPVDWVVAKYPAFKRFLEDLV